MGTIKTFRYSELSEAAREKVRMDDAADSGYLSAHEALYSLKALAKHFDGRLSDYSIDFFGGYSSATFDMPEDMEPETIKAKLDELGTYDPKTLRGNGECKLTGYCVDEDAIDGFRKAFHAGETELGKLMQAAFKSWLKACQNDCEAFYSDEYYAETAEANEWEYLADGTFVSSIMKAE